MLFQSFFNFRVAIKTLKSARRREFDFLHFASETETSFIDITHVPSLFVGHNDEVFRHKYTIQHDPKKIILNFCGYVVWEAERSLLLRNLNFSILPKELNQADCLVNFFMELLYRVIHNLEVFSAEDLDFMKAKTKDVTLSSFRSYNYQCIFTANQHLSFFDLHYSFPVEVYSYRIFHIFLYQIKS